MAEKSGMNWKLGQIKQLSNKLKEVVDSYVSKITGSAQVWIHTSEGCNQQSFVEVNMQLDQTVLILTEKVSEIESQLASQLLETGIVEITLNSATSSQISVGSQVIDQPLSSHQERIHSLESAVGSFQAGLDRCRKQIGSVEGMKANLENLASQVEVITNDKSVQQIQQEIEYYKSKEVVRMQSFEDQLLTIENTLSSTDCRLKDLGVLSKSLTEKNRTLCDTFSKFDHRFFDLEKKSGKTDDRVTVMEEKLTGIEDEIKQVKLHMDGVIKDNKKSSSDVKDIREQLTTFETKVSNIKENDLQSLGARLLLLEEDKKAQAKIDKKGVEEADSVLPAGIKEIQPRRTFTGFIASGSVSQSLARKSVMKFYIHAISTDTLFNEDTGQFTAAVDGLYYVIFSHRHIDVRMHTQAILYLTHSNPKSNKKFSTAKTVTKAQDSIDANYYPLNMKAGDMLSLTMSGACDVEIGVFCCVLTDWVNF